MTIKHAQIEEEELRWLYLDIGDLADCAPDGPRLLALADRAAVCLDALAAEVVGLEEEHPISDDLVALLDTASIESFACAPVLLALLKKRGWTGWTNTRRIGTSR